MIDFSLVVAGAALVTAALLVGIIIYVLRGRRRLQAVRRAHPDAISFESIDGGGLWAVLSTPGPWTFDANTKPPSQFVVGVDAAAVRIWDERATQIAELPGLAIQSIDGTMGWVGNRQSSIIVVSVRSQPIQALRFGLLGGDGRVLPASQVARAETLAQRMNSSRPPTAEHDPA
jgi:hypothetical protein